MGLNAQLATGSETKKPLNQLLPYCLVKIIVCMCSNMDRVNFGGCREQMENTCNGIQGVGRGHCSSIDNHPPPNTHPAHLLS